MPFPDRSSLLHLTSKASFRIRKGNLRAESQLWQTLSVYCSERPQLQPRLPPCSWPLPAALCRNNSMCQQRRQRSCHCRRCVATQCRLEIRAAPSSPVHCRCAPVCWWQQRLAAWAGLGGRAAALRAFVRFAVQWQLLMPDVVVVVPCQPYRRAPVRVDGSAAVDLGEIGRACGFPILVWCHGPIATTCSRQNESIREAWRKWAKCALTVWQVWHFMWHMPNIRNDN